MRALLPQRGLAHAITSDQTFVVVIAAQLLRGDGSTRGTETAFSAFHRLGRVWLGFSFSSNGFCKYMDNLSGYAHRPLAFVLRYLRRRLASHVVILAAVVAAVACSVGTQYGVKYLVDGLSAGPARAGSVWLAFVFLMSLIAADNFLWRIRRLTPGFTFWGGTGDFRRGNFSRSTQPPPAHFSRPRPVDPANHPSPTANRR